MLVESLVESNVDKENMHFLHIGKTGGSALDYVIRKHPQTDRYNLIYHFHDATLEDIPMGQSIFFCVREPLSRFVSSFYSRQRKGKPRYNFEWTDEENIAFSTFDTVNKLGLALATGSGDRYDAAIHALTNIYHVKSSYYDWFKSNEYFLSRLEDIRFVGFQESLNQDFERLKKILGLPEEAALPSGDVDAHRNPEKVDRYLAPEATEALKDWYEKEYSFYDLCKKIKSDGGFSMT